MPTMPPIFCLAGCYLQTGLQGALAGLLSPEMQRGPHLALAP